MRGVLQDVETTRGTAADSRAAAVISSLLVLPFVILESLNQTINRQNAPGLAVLFGLLWLLPLAFVVVLMPMVRVLRAGQSLSANPFNLLFRVALLALVATAWAGIVADQTPCFLGVPNCD